MSTPSESIPLLPPSKSTSELKIFEASEITKEKKPALGAGAFSAVFEVKLYAGKQKAALKKLKCESGIVNNQLPKSNFYDTLKREASLVNKFVHPNIVELLGVCYDDEYFGLLLELCEGNSLKFLLKKLKDREIPRKVSTDWALQVAQGMSYLAWNKYMHRDLKTENVLVKQPVCLCEGSERMALANYCPRCKKRPLDKLTLKICDLGCTKSQNSVGHSVAGSYSYMVPEIVKSSRGVQTGKVLWTEYADVWSYGVLLWSILTKQRPPDRRAAMLGNDEAEEEICHPELEPSVAEEMKKIMIGCWKMVPEERVTFQNIVKSLEDYQQKLRSENNVATKMENGNEKTEKLKLIILIILFLIVLFILAALLILF